MLKQINEQLLSEQCSDSLYTNAFIYADPCFETENFTSLHLHFVRRQRSTFAHQNSVAERSAPALAEQL